MLTFSISSGDHGSFHHSSLCSPPTGSSESSVFLWSIILFIARLPALLVSATKSAPTKPGVDLAIFMRSNAPSTLRLRVSTDKMSTLAFSFGMPKTISRSNRPGLLNAGSMESGLFVAPITKTWLDLPSSPSCIAFPCPPSTRSEAEFPSACCTFLCDSSMHVINCVTIRRSISRCTFSLFEAMASISSINTIDGAVRCFSSCGWYNGTMTSIFNSSTTEPIPPRSLNFGPAFGLSTLLSIPIPPSSGPFFPKLTAGEGGKTCFPFNNETFFFTLLASLLFTTSTSITLALDLGVVFAFCSLRGIITPGLGIRRRQFLVCGLLFPLHIPKMLSLNLLQSLLALVDSPRYLSGGSRLVAAVIAAVFYQATSGIDGLKDVLNAFAEWLHLLPPILGVSRAEMIYDLLDGGVLASTRFYLSAKRLKAAAAA
nr:hypothetical protein A4E25_00432 [Ipomoea batatas]